MLFRHPGFRTPVIALLLLLCCTLSPIEVGAQPGLDGTAQPLGYPVDTIHRFVQPRVGPGIPSDKVAPDFSDTDQGVDPAPADPNQADTAGNAGSANSHETVVTGVPNTGAGITIQA